MKIGGITEGRCHAVEAGGRKILLTRVQGQVQAVENKCSHMGMNMAKGKVEAGVLQCPWHGAKFDVCTGANVEWVQNFPGGIKAPQFMHKVIAMGKQPAPLAHFNAIEDGGRVFISLGA
jgi:nitrite reductase/ring-hydroxylating ferredoxin subunit